MEDVDLRHAKEHLEDLIERARRGEDVRIADPGRGTVRLVAVPTGVGDASPFPPRIFGQWKHLDEIPEERMFAPLTDEELAWLSGEASEVAVCIWSGTTPG